MSRVDLKARLRCEILLILGAALDAAHLTRGIWARENHV